MLVFCGTVWSASKEKEWDDRCEVVLSAAPVFLMSAIGPLVAWRRGFTAKAKAKHYAPFVVIGFLMMTGGGYGVDRLEREYDKHVILLSVYGGSQESPCATLNPQAIRH